MYTTNYKILSNCSKQRWLTLLASSTTAIFLHFPTHGAENADASIPSMLCFQG